MDAGIKCQNQYFMEESICKATDPVCWMSMSQDWGRGAVSGKVARGNRGDELKEEKQSPLDLQCLRKSAHVSRSLPRR